jgi:hypothetical protein
VRRRLAMVNNVSETEKRYSFGDLPAPSFVDRIAIGYRFRVAE